MLNRLLLSTTASLAALALVAGGAVAQYAAPGGGAAPGGAPAAGGAQAPMAAPMAPAAGQAAAPAPAGDEHAAVVAALAGTTHTLAEGIEQVAIGTEVPIEAKFEVEDGALQLSVYTAAMGLETMPEDNSFKEYKGPATQVAWAPETEVFEDFEHIARSAAYQALMSMTDVTIPQIIEVASEGGATVISVKPKVIDGAPVFEVFSVRNGEVVEAHYSLTDGAPV
jgi:hypothetical protein